MTFYLNAKSMVFAAITVILSIVSNPLSAFDPPASVIRVSYMSNPVSFAPAGENDWSTVELNRPLYIGDRLWSEENSRTELELEGGYLYLGGSTSLSISNFDDNLVQLKLTQGRLNLFIQNLAPNQIYEVDTPNLAFTVRQPGYYQVDVADDQSATVTSAVQGSAEVYGIENAFKIREGSAFRFYGDDLTDYEPVNISNDDFDQWCLSRATQGAESSSAHYVSSNVIGYQDLDNYGQWITDPDYGPVWYPAQVPDDWAPYSDGDWSWIDPWGWTWIDNQPWGFAPCHYGRWVFYHSRWGWVPGPRNARAMYAPALVGFIGSDGFNLGISLGSFYGRGIGWFPLGPQDAYVPPYKVSRNYFYRLNRTNSSVLDNRSLATIYDNHGNNITYQNFKVPNAVTAVPLSTFVRSLSVAPKKVKITANDINNIDVSKIKSFAPVTPKQASVLGGGKTGIAPPKRLLEKPVVTNAKVPLPPVEFSKKQALLAEEPGKPLAPVVLQKMKEPVPVKEVPVVPKVSHVPSVAPAAERTPNLLPPSQRPIPTQEPGIIPSNREQAPEKRVERILPFGQGNLESIMRGPPQAPRVITVPPREEPQVITAPRETPRAITTPREAPRIITAPREEPRIITVPREEPREVAPLRAEPSVITPSHQEAPRVVAPPPREMPRYSAPSPSREEGERHK